MFAFFKALPKWAIVISALVVSTSLFVVWYLFLSPSRREVVRIHNKQQEENTDQKARSLQSRTHRLFIAAGDLYDAESGECIFRNWLKGDVPSQLFFDPRNQKLIGRLDRGFARYALDGTREATLGLDNSPAFSSDLRQAIYCKNGDIWKADIDWQEFRFINERRITSTGEFQRLKLDDNVLLSSPRYLIIRHHGKALQIDMTTGTYRPSKIPLLAIAKRRSPDFQQLVGEEVDKLFAYDVETDKGTSWPVGRDRLVDTQWLSADKCSLLVAGQKIGLYNRKENTLLKELTLPFSCQRMAEPSPDGRYVFCANRTTLVLVDFEYKVAKPIVGGNGLGWLDSTSYIFTRDVSDTERRGVWLQSPGGEERRVSPEPYLTSMDGSQGAIFRLPTTSTGQPGPIVFVTKKAIFRMNPDGTGLREIVAIDQAPTHLLSIEPWKAATISDAKTADTGKGR